MPLYEYRCESCGKVHEVLQRMSAPPLTECETCGGKLQKLLSSPAFQFKGSGWYVTDYARKGGEGGSGPSANGEKESSKSGESAATSESKSEGATTSSEGSKEGAGAKTEPSGAKSGANDGSKSGAKATD